MKSEQHEMRSEGWRPEGYVIECACGWFIAVKGRAIGLSMYASHTYAAEQLKGRRRKSSSRLADVRTESRPLPAYRGDFATAPRKRWWRRVGR